MTKVLIIDDNLDVGEILKIYLEYNKIDVDLVDDNIKILEIYKNDPYKYEYVFIDYMMNTMDGFSLLNELYKINPSINAYICSGRTLSKKIKNNVKVYGFIQKPFNIDDVNKIIKTWEDKN
jgi:DNA-binding NtrC family response regulator